MGAWGHRTFQDDSACDWVYDLEAAEDPLQFLDESLTPEDTDYIEYDDGCAILGACETIYGIKHESREPQAEAFTKWVDNHKSLDVSSLVPKAITAVQSVLGEDSELNELWSENPEFYSQWRARIEELIAGLQK